MSDQLVDARPQQLEEAVKGKIGYLLALIAVVQFGYPITSYGTAALLAYQVLYASLIAVGIFVGRDSPRHQAILITTGFIYLVAGIVYTLQPSAQRVVLVTYVALIPYHGMLATLLLRFIFTARSITRDVLYAATALYLLLGAIFVPLYGIVETLTPGAFFDANGQTLHVQWQQLLYFSYTTLTTAGYGDVLPVSWWARSLANAEMVVGVLYLTIVMARLVSLYSSTRYDEGA